MMRSYYFEAIGRRSNLHSLMHEPSERSSYDLIPVKLKKKIRKLFRKLLDLVLKIDLHTQDPKYLSAIKRFARSFSSELSIEEGKEKRTEAEDSIWLMTYLVKERTITTKAIVFLLKLLVRAIRRSRLNKQKADRFQALQKSISFKIKQNTKEGRDFTPKDIRYFREVMLSI